MDTVIKADHRGGAMAFIAVVVGIFVASPAWAMAQPGTCAGYYPSGSPQYWLACDVAKTNHQTCARLLGGQMGVRGCHERRRELRPLGEREGCSENRQAPTGPNGL